MSGWMFPAGKLNSISSPINLWYKICSAVDALTENDCIVSCIWISSLSLEYLHRSTFLSHERNSLLFGDVIVMLIFFFPLVFISASIVRTVTEREVYPFKKPDIYISVLHPLLLLSPVLSPVRRT